MKDATIKTAFLYARTYGDRKAENGPSIPDELAQMRSYCEKNCIQLVKEYVARGRATTNDNRTQFQQVMADALESPQRIDCIIVHSFSRASRNLDDMIVHVRRLRAKRIRLISITQEVDETAPGRMMMMIHGLVDRLNSSESSKRVKRARRAIDSQQ